MELLFLGEDEILFNNFLELSDGMITKKNICLVKTLETLNSLIKNEKIKVVFVDADSIADNSKKQFEILSSACFKHRPKIILFKDCNKVQGFDKFCTLSIDGIVFKPLTKKNVTEQISKALSICEQDEKNKSNEKLIQLGELAGGVSHEINNPIAYVKSNISSIAKYFSLIERLLEKHDVLYQIISDKEIISEKEKEDYELQDILIEIDDYKRKIRLDFLLKDMSKIIDDTNTGLKLMEDISLSIKDFIRGNQRECKSKHLLNNIVSSSLRIVKGRAKNTTTIHEDLRSENLCFCNKTQISQVIMNLVTNSIQALESNNNEKDGIIKIRTYDEKDFCVCEISDNGPGIPDEIKEKIFEAFFTTKEMGEGTGLGLSICRDIIMNKHSGNLFVENQPTQGTKFIFKIPVAK